jgi:hypothetical protein
MSNEWQTDEKVFHNLAGFGVHGVWQHGLQHPHIKLKLLAIQHFRPKAPPDVDNEGQQQHQHQHQ